MNDNYLKLRLDVQKLMISIPFEKMVYQRQWPHCGEELLVLF